MGLVQIGERYYFNKRVPTHLLDAYRKVEGKKSPHVKIALGTSDKRQAEELMLEKEQEFLLLCKKLEHFGKYTPKQMNILSFQLKFRKLCRTRDRDLDLHLIHELQQQLRDEYEKIKRIAQLNDDPDYEVTPHLGRYRGKEVSPETYLKDLQSSMRVLAVFERMFNQPELDVRKELDHLQRDFEHSELTLGEYLLDDLQHGRETKAESNIKQVMAKSDAPKLSEALQTWQRKRSPRPSTLSEWQHAVRRFIELHGDLPVNQIEGKTHIVQFREAIADMPTRLPKRYSALPIQEILALAKAGKLPDRKREANTVNKFIVAIYTILEVMKEDGHIESNPAQDKRLKEKDNSASRPPFEKNDLKRLFESDLYAKPYSHSLHGKRPARYWLPLLSLFTSGRLDELGGLRVDDVRQKEGVHYIAIRGSKNEDRAVKSKAANRDVPLHPKLIKCGFLRYVMHRKKSGQDTLFPDYKRSYSQWFSRELEKLGLKEKGLTFHCFRDTFRDEAENTDMPPAVLNQLFGHSRGKAESHYGYGVSIAKAKDEIGKMYRRWPDLRHLCN